MKSQGFEFLRAENETLANLGDLAEEILFIDTGSALTRLRAFASEPTKSIYKEAQLLRLAEAAFNDLIRNSSPRNDTRH